MAKPPLLEAQQSQGDTAMTMPKHEVNPQISINDLINACLGTTEPYGSAHSEFINNNLGRNLANEIENLFGIRPEYNIPSSGTGGLTNLYEYRHFCELKSAIRLGVSPYTQIHDLVHLSHCLRDFGGLENVLSDPQLRLQEYFSSTEELTNYLGGAEKIEGITLRISENKAKYENS